MATLADLEFPAVVVRPFCADCCVWIYFIHAEKTDAVKIGYTKSPAKRIWALQDSTADSLRFIALFSALVAVERELHYFYADEHIRGEWFRPSPRLLAFAAHVGIDQAGRAGTRK